MVRGEKGGGSSPAMHAPQRRECRGSSSTVGDMANTTCSRVEQMYYHSHTLCYIVHTYIHALCACGDEANVIARWRISTPIENTDTCTYTHNIIEN